MHAETEARWHGLDAVRAFALLLGVVLHLCMSFLPGAQFFWIASDSSQSTVVGPLFFVIHTFRMLLFFVLAGFFARLLLQRIGWREFVRNRWRRVVLPLLCFWPLLLSAIVAVLVLGTLLKQGQLPANPPPGPRFTADDFPLTHLWFLYQLVLAYGALLFVRFLAKTCGVTDVINNAIGTWLHRAFWSLPLLLAIALAISLYLQPQWYMWFGIPTPDRQLYPNWPSAIGFGGAFALGWYWHRYRTDLSILASSAPWCLLFAIVGSVLCLQITGAAPSLTVADKTVHTAIYALLYALSAWCWVCAIIGIGLRYLQHHNATLRYLADASYWVYLMHLPLVMLLQIVIRDWSLAWWAKLPLSFAVAMALLLLSYHGIVRRSWIGVMLNGRRAR